MPATLSHNHVSGRAAYEDYVLSLSLLSFYSKSSKCIATVPYVYGLTGLLQDLECHKRCTVAE